MATRLAQRAHEIFGRMLDQPLAQRADFLDVACAGDAELRAEIETLLRHDAAAGASFMAGLPPIYETRTNQEPGAPVPSNDGHSGAADPLIGRRIARFEVLSLIGRGGMGMVYLARQEHPLRLVALKLMRPMLGTPGLDRRFQFEAEVLGRLTHPGIAQVYDAGIAEVEPFGALPYFAMEYVPNARPITEYCDAEGLDLRQRLELFATVCDAVHAGHQQGVIHRDLKPANMLIGQAERRGRDDQNRDSEGANHPRPDRKGGRDPGPDRKGGRDPRPDRQGGRDPRPDRQGGRDPRPDRKGGRDPRPDRKGGRERAPDVEPEHPLPCGRASDSPGPDRALPRGRALDSPGPDRALPRGRALDSPGADRALPCGRASDPDGARGRAADSPHRRNGDAPSRASVPASLRAFPKIIDFGVARVTDSDQAMTTMATATGEIIGTIQYMSPEQCDGNSHHVDTRSDVYSLGVTLYELLTGALPYKASGTSLYHAIRTIREEPPKPPSSLSRRLRGDLEAIVLKALEKNRDQRYGSAADLAQDIRRYLNREPVEARPPTAWTRAVKWVARHPMVVTVALCVAILVATGAAARLTWWYLMMRPDHVEVLNDGRAAVLRTAGNIPLRTWGADAAGSVPFVREWKGTLGGKARHLAFIGFKNAGKLEYKPGVYVFDCNRYRDPPLWAGRLEPNDVPSVLEGEHYAPNNFYGRTISVADVFDPPAGPELIVAHQHDSYTQTALRIYALDGGDVLWQVWLDFEVDGTEWLAVPGLLVIAGVDGRVYWEQRGATGLSVANPHPRCVIGIRARHDYREAHYVAPDHPDPHLRPAWIACLLPPRAAQRTYFYRDTISPWSSDTEREHCAVAACFYSAEAVGVTWAFDGNGPRTDVRPRYGGNYVGRTTLSPDDPLWVPSPERIDPNTGKPEIYWGDLPEIQWFHADDKHLDPVTRDLRRHFGVDPTAGKPRRQ